MNFEYISVLPEPVLLNYLEQEGIINYSNDLELRLIVTKLYHKHNELLPDENKYLEHPNFDDMYMTSDSELVDLALQNNISITKYTSRFELVRLLLEANVEPPVSSMFARVPTPNVITSTMTSPLNINRRYSQESNIRRAHRESLRRPISGIPVRTIPSPHRSTVHLEDTLFTPPSPPSYTNQIGELIQLSPPEMSKPLSPEITY